MTQNSSAHTAPLLIVVTSFPSMEAARPMAKLLVEQNLAACVQMMEGVQSVYRWEGRICEEQEILLSAKTIASKWLEISTFIKDKHPYEMPEILAFSPEQYDQQYSQWIQSEVNSKA